MRGLKDKLRDITHTAFLEYRRAIDVHGLTPLPAFRAFNIANIIALSGVILLGRTAIAAGAEIKVVLSAFALLVAACTLSATSALIRRLRDAGYTPWTLGVVLGMSVLAGMAWFVWIMIAAGGLQPGPLEDLAPKLLTGMTVGMTAQIYWISLTVPSCRAD